ncbi:MAG: TrmH family RNA methyltransferase [Candidatus Portnoybacteria bacterium]|nr:TrmH family RNA methyltransferase [Candidatus Portnoybacteria bacterium]
MFYAALSNIRSLYNVGALFRTADAFGICRIIIGGYTGYPPHKEITKTALGAENWVPWERSYRLPQRLKALKNQGFHIIGLENNIKGTTPLPFFRPQFPLVLVVGNEVRGISESVKKEVDAFVSIPMQGKKESLNVAVAFGIAAYIIATYRAKMRG